MLADNDVEMLDVASIDVPGTSLERCYDLQGLVNSLGRFGQIEPIIVRPSAASRYELVCGSRRLAAAKKLGWEKIQARNLILDDIQSASLMLAENLERESFTDYDMGKLFENLSNRFGMSYSQIAEISGRSRAFVSQHISMTRLFSEETIEGDSALQEALSHLTERQARILSHVGDVKERLILAKITAKEELSIKQLEKLVGKHHLSSVPSSAVESNDPWQSSYSSERSAMKAESNTRVKFAQSDAEQIRDRIEWFFSCINDKNFQAFVHFRDESVFTLFDDFPPFDLLLGRQAITHCFDIMESTRGRLQFAYSDLRINTFDNFAIATFHIAYGEEVSGHDRARVSVVFRKMKGRWMIVHEHWSPATVYEPIHG